MTKRKITPSKNKDNRNLFRRAADVLRRGKWTRHHWFKGDKPGDNMLGSYCLTGAVLKAEALEKGQTEKLTDDSLDGNPYQQSSWYRELQEVMPKGVISPESWNDTKAKDKKEVIEVLEGLAGDES